MWVKWWSQSSIRDRWMIAGGWCHQQTLKKVRLLASPLPRYLTHNPNPATYWYVFPCGKAWSNAASGLPSRSWCPPFSNSFLKNPIRTSKHFKQTMICGKKDSFVVCFFFEIRVLNLWGTTLNLYYEAYLCDPNTTLPNRKKNHEHWAPDASESNLPLWWVANLDNVRCIDP